MPSWRAWRFQLVSTPEDFHSDMCHAKEIQYRKKIKVYIGIANLIIELHEGHFVILGTEDSPAALGLHQRIRDGAFHHPEVCEGENMVEHLKSMHLDKSRPGQTSFRGTFAGRRSHRP